ncbi:MAG: DNA alkylation repair protein [Pirellulaceae bacterium]|nr:DNA alkylation repair protein [Pirellulaceae bacterium]
MPLTAAAVKRELKSRVNPEKAAFYPRFFKAGPGEYAEGDQFLGVVVPDQRKTARQYRGLPRQEIHKLLDDPYHECRLTGLFILIDQFEKTKNQTDRKSIVDDYLSRTDAVNHWDLVDASAHKILGVWLIDQTNRSVLVRLSKSPNLWEQRIAIVATYALIRRGELDDTLQLAETMLDHPHDLIHKATGWMLREVGKQQPSALEHFLHQHAPHMPRTMLRYAIEKMSPSQRQVFLQMQG